MQIIPLHIEKEIEPSDDISKLILMSSDLHDGDILVVAQKIISKQEGRVVNLSEVIPSELAIGIAREYNKDPKLVEKYVEELTQAVICDATDESVLSELDLANSEAVLVAIGKDMHASIKEPWRKRHLG